MLFLRPSAFEFQRAERLYGPCQASEQFRLSPVDGSSVLLLSD
jgi:hypothetical protein